MSASQSWFGTVILSSNSSAAFIMIKAADDTHYSAATGRGATSTAPFSVLNSFKWPRRVV
jgi:hypothetical protein